MIELGFLYLRRGNLLHRGQSRVFRELVFQLNVEQGLSILRLNLIEFQKAPECFIFAIDFIGSDLYAFVCLHCARYLVLRLMPLAFDLLSLLLQVSVVRSLVVESGINCLCFVHIQVDHLLQSSDVLIVHHPSHSIVHLLLPVTKLLLHLLHVAEVGIHEVTFVLS